MDERTRPVLVGLAAGVVLLVVPGGLAAVVLIAAALMAGWVLPQAPMVAALLFLAPTAVLATARLMTDDVDVSIPALGVAVVGTIAFTAIFTHVGAGIALRRNAS